MPWMEFGVVLKAENHNKSIGKEQKQSRLLICALTYRSQLVWMNHESLLRTGSNRFSVW